MKQLFIMSLIFYSLCTQAQDNKKFCQEIVQVNEQQNQNFKPSTLSIVRGILFPHHVVFLNKLRAQDNGFTRKNDNKHLVLNLIHQNDQHYSEDFKEKLNQYKTIKRKLQQNRFAQKMAKVTSIETCLKLTKENKNEYHIFQNLSSKLNSFISYQKRFERLETHKFVLSQIKKLKRRGWTVHEKLTLKVLDSIMHKDPQQLIIVTHALSNGVIKDANGRVIPPTVFSNTSTELRKLSLFSCYTEKVKKLYQINKRIKQNRFDYIYPIVQPAYQGFFKNQTPLFAVKSLSNYHTNLLYMPKRELKKKCTLSFDASEMKHSVAVYLNRSFLGMIQKDMPFYCDLLKEKNQITLTPIEEKIDEQQIYTLPTSAQIDSEYNQQYYHLEHFVQRQSYRGSKSTIKE